MNVVLNRCLVAFVELHASRAAVLVELADAVDLVAAAIANGLHYFLRLLSMRHRSSLALERPNDIVVDS